MSARVSWGLLLGLLLSVAAADDVVPSNHEQADSVLVVKSERKLYLLQAGRVLRTFDVALGLVPSGPKQREGDFRTPEGKYFLESRNTDSDYFLSIKVSYPNEQDRARARAQGLDPGGQIMIHGLPNEPRFAQRHYESSDWTDGCIAVSNSDISSGPRPWMRR